MIRLRRQLPALTDGRMEQVRVRFDEAAHWLALERGPVTVVCNLAASAQSVPLPTERSPQLLLSSEADVSVTAAGVTTPAAALVILSTAAP